MTKRAGRSAENDDVPAARDERRNQRRLSGRQEHGISMSQPPLASRFDENTENIRASVAHIVSQGREALFDAEHFFDGYKANPDYALTCLHAAFDSGARWIVLCDTNGGTLPSEVSHITAAVIAAGIPGDRLGIHTHNDTEMAVAATLAAVDAGARQIQGTLNGLGERCGNANLTALIPTLLLKEPYASTLRRGSPTTRWRA